MLYFELELFTREVWLYNFVEDEKWMESCGLEKWESTLNLCVHAHGHDVDRIIKASLKLIIPLV